MNIQIVRNRKTNVGTSAEPTILVDGQLFIDGTRICDTAENVQNSLPSGQYSVAIHKCHQYARKMPVILSAGQNQPDCSACGRISCVTNSTPMPCVCPMLKVGNGVCNRADGSIILGEHIIPGCLMRSRKAFYPLYHRIRKAIERGNCVTIDIIEQ